MIDLHSHTLFSDGALVPSELVRRAEVTGYRAIALTDHVDISNYAQVAASIAEFCERYMGAVTVIPGVELTHVPPGQFEEVAALCRERGAKLVVAHGETIVEPVAPGTNRAAIEAGVDILVHPGLLSDDDAALAAERGVALEISGRGGHSFTNGHVAAMAKKHGAHLVFCTDAHQPRDLMTRAMAESVARGAGLLETDIKEMFDYAESVVERLK